MKFEWHAKSVAFWMFRGLIFLALIFGVCFSLLTVQAESLYQKTPRLSERNRMDVPKASPLLNLEPDSSADSRIHDTPPPSVYSNVNSDWVPVSWQPERTEKKDNHAPASPPVPQLKPPHPVKPADGESRSHGEGKTIEWHPVVLGPSTGLAHKASADPPKKNTATASNNAAVKSPVVPDATHKIDSRKIAAVQKGQVSQEKPVALQTSAEPVAYKQSNAHKSNEKPLVHFPQPLSDTRAAKNAIKSAMEPGFYPVGYRPYLPASAVIVSGQYQEALSHYNRGSYYGHANQLSKAILEYQQAIRKNPDLADAYVGLSSAYLLKTQWEEVFLNARKALSLKAGFMDKDNIIQAKFNLSTAYCASDDYGQAKFFYNSVKLANHAQTRELWEYLKKNCKP